jgi:hypothetical protein
MEQYGGTIEQVTITATAAGTTVLTNVSTQIQVFTGTLAQNIQLPNAESYTKPGGKFEIYNLSTQTVAVQLNSTAGLQTIPASSTLIVKLVNNSTTDGVWVTLSNSSAPPISSTQSQCYGGPTSGYGISGTTTRTWSNVVTVGTDITYTPSASNSDRGDIFTINTTGYYSIQYGDQFGTANEFMGVTNGANSGGSGTNVELLTRGQVLSCVRTPTTTGVGVQADVPAVWLTVGSIIAFQTDGNSSGGQPISERFVISKIL